MATLQEKLASVRMGDRVTYANKGARIDGEVIGWRNVPPTYHPHALVLCEDGLTYQQVSLRNILERRRAGVTGGIIQFD